MQILTWARNVTTQSLLEVLRIGGKGRVGPATPEWKRNYFLREGIYKCDVFRSYESDLPDGQLAQPAALGIVDGPG